MTAVTTSTTTYHPGDLVLVAFPFSNGVKAKRRPALVVLDSGDADIVVARVTTRIYQTRFDIALVDWSAAGLLAASVVRLHKIATLQRSLVAHRMGTVSTADHAKIAAVLASLYGSW
jgi:mRNA interferase MazF